MSQSSTPDSSELGESIDIDVVDRRGQAREQVLEALQRELEALRRRNQELEEKLGNAQTAQMRVAEDERDVKRRLKQLQRENEDLKNRLLQLEQSFQSEQSSRQAAKIDFKHKPHKLHSKSTKSKQIRLSSNGSESSCAQLKVFDNSLQLRKLQTQKLVLQKQLYELKESLLIIEHQRKWSMNLAHKIVDLAEQLSSVFKEELFRRDWDLQKRAKVSWRYLKHILKYIFSDQ